MAMSGCEERALLEVNRRRETWCQVERQAAQAWERPERRHFRCHLRTSGAQPGGEQHRAAWMLQQLPARRPERRHFEESYKTHLVSSATD
ncbi:spermatogenesis-associated protein 45 [Myripristis murdjan]|uniref:spermatogenesis-associated protein 45 n=1 Tax=Myripristis murdjan TaxID=586833 RepID=UPI001175CC8A|nr:spermatogenesis-associated protein 45-like [Myripristis murdjan]